MAARDRLLAFARERFGDDEGVGILDETGFLKKGDKSVGVQRQYSGTAGRIENSPVGVFLGHAGRSGRVLLDRALYLPRSWADDGERRRAARVPARVRFHTKPALGARMLRRAWAAGVPMGWVTGAEVYGDDPGLRVAIARAGRRYVLAVGAGTPAWATRPAATATAPRDPPKPPPASAIAPWLVSAHALGSSVTELAPAPGFGASVERRLPASGVWAPRLRATAFITTESFSLNKKNPGLPPGDVGAGLYALRLEACPLQLPLARRLAFSPCAGLDVGVLKTVGSTSGVKVEDSGVWLASVGLGRLQWFTPADPLVFEVQGGAFTPLIEHSIVVDTPRTVLRHSPAAGAFFSVGVGMAFQ